MRNRQRLCRRPRVKMRWLLIGLAVLGSVPPGAAAYDDACKSPLVQSTGDLDWSDGNYRICVPRVDDAGKELPEAYEMICKVYIDAVPVATQRATPGEFMKGDHQKSGVGIATATCKGVDGRVSEPAAPREVKLSR